MRVDEGKTVEFLWFVVVTWLDAFIVILLKQAQAICLMSSSALCLCFYKKKKTIWFISLIRCEDLQELRHVICSVWCHMSVCVRVCDAGSSCLRRSCHRGHWVGLRARRRPDQLSRHYFALSSSSWEPTNQTLASLKSSPNQIFIYVWENNAREPEAKGNLCL